VSIGARERARSLPAASVCLVVLDGWGLAEPGPGNAVSLAQALFSPDAWYRAIYADDTPAGFLMLYDESLRTSPPAHPEIALWRFMVDAQFQGQGVGTAALEQVIAHVRNKGLFSSLLVSYVPAPGSPEQFYLQAAGPPRKTD